MYVYVRRTYESIYFCLFVWASVYYIENIRREITQMRKPYLRMKQKGRAGMEKRREIQKNEIERMSDKRREQQKKKWTK